MEVYYDFETRSDLDLTKFGTMNHLHTPHSDIVCLAYRLGMDSPTELWLPNMGMPLPEVFIHPQGHIFYAHNIQFDMMVHNILGKKYGFGHVELQQCRDVMALCGRYGLPQSLAKAAIALGTIHEKDEAGKPLMTKICGPPFKYTREEMIAFLRYAISDVDTMCDIVNALPSPYLSAEEQSNWELTVKINTTGLPIDIDSVNRINAIVQRYIADQTKKVSVITDGALYSINQLLAIPKWIREQGVDIPNLQAATVTEYLEKELPDNVRELLELRQLIGRNSVKKYQSLVRQYHRGRIYYNLRYYGGHTGRFAGMGFQVHNLPRAKVEDVEGAIKKFHNLSILNNGERPVEVAKALIRPMVLASTGKILLVADYSSIEFCLMMWIVDDFETLIKLKKGEDVYVEFAAEQLYHVDKSAITKQQRQVGKTTCLGAIYYLGAPKLIAYCKQVGITLQSYEAIDCINAFRTAYWRVPPMWDAVKRCVINAIDNPGMAFNAYKCVFKVARCRNKNSWLTIKLPSGRVMYYNDPLIVDGNFGRTPTHMGIDPDKKTWVRRQLPPNRITENIIQALARDILLYGEHLIHDMTPYKILASVHDENIIEIPDDNCPDSHWNIVESLMTQPPSWCKNLPLAVSGYVERRYRKD